MGRRADPFRSGLCRAALHLRRSRAGICPCHARRARRCAHRLGRLSGADAARRGRRHRQARDTRWRGWYHYFPWEDWRDGKPPMIDAVILPKLKFREGGCEQPGCGTAPRPRPAVLRHDGVPGTRKRCWSATSFFTKRGWCRNIGRDNGDRRLDTGLGAAMMFDHRRILATAIARLRGKMKYRPVVFELMAPSFTLLELQRTVEALLGLPPAQAEFPPPGGGTGSGGRNRKSSPPPHAADRRNCSGSAAKCCANVPRRAFGWAFAVESGVVLWCFCVRETEAMMKLPVLISGGLCLGLAACASPNAGKSQWRRLCGRGRRHL